MFVVSIIIRVGIRFQIRILGYQILVRLVAYHVLWPQILQ